MVIAAGLIGFAGNELVAGYRIRVGRRIGSAALVADGLHARTDGFTSLAVVVGAVGVLAGFPLADPIVGLLITVAILVVLRGRGPRGLPAADGRRRPGAGRRGRDDACGPSRACVDVGELRLRWIGHRLRAETGIAVETGLAIAEAHDIAVDAEHALLHAVPKLVAATVHVSPHDDTGHDHHAEIAHHPAALDPGAITRRPSR